MSDILSLSGLACPIPLHGLSKNDRRLSRRIDGLGIRRINFRRVMPTSIEAPNVFIAHIGHHFEQFRRMAKEVLAGIATAPDLVSLIVAVDDLFHASPQDSMGIFGEQWIPVAPPDHLENTPACTPKTRLELLDNFAIASNGTIQSLKIAVDHKNQIVELLTAGQRDGPQALRFIGLAVAQKAPNLAIINREKSTVLHVLHKAGLIDRRQGAQAHRNRGELPEIGHQSRMGIRGQAAAIHLPAKIMQLLLGQTTF